MRKCMSVDVMVAGRDTQFFGVSNSDSSISVLIPIANWSGRFSSIDYISQTFYGVYAEKILKCFNEKNQIIKDDLSRTGYFDLKFLTTAGYKELD